VPVEPGSIRTSRRCEHQETDRQEETDMTSTARTLVSGGRLRLTLAAVVVLVAFTVSTAMAAAAPVGAPAAELVASANTAANPHTLTPGFLLDRGRYRGFDAPQARFSTLPYGINDHGQVVGRYDDGSEQPFLRDRRGRFTTLAIPGARSAWASGINDRGQILGATADPADGAGLAALRPFVLDRGRFVSFRAPDAPVTFPYDLNNRGQIVGYTVAPTATDPVAGARGFLLARGARGPFTPIDVPDAPRSVAYGLNDAGAIVGQYENTAATPSPQATGMAPLRLMRQGDLAAVVSDRAEDL
jgi:hypothetical protein